MISSGTDPISGRDHSPGGQAVSRRSEHLQRLLHPEDRVLQAVQPEREVQQRQVARLHQPVPSHWRAWNGSAQQQRAGSSGNNLLYSINQNRTQLTIPNSHIWIGQ